jgi:hypothetical protein
MAGIVYANSGKMPGYQGLGGIFEFVNADGKLVSFNCGQAAAATLLAHQGCFPAGEATAAQRMHALEAVYPPDNLGGWLGTSRRRVTQICRAHGVRLEEVAGEVALRTALDQRRPVIVMLGVSRRKFFGRRLPSGHWMVAYGYDLEHVYLTNWGTMNWDEFRAGWTGLVPRSSQMRERGLTATR